MMWRWAIVALTVACAGPAFAQTGAAERERALLVDRLTLNSATTQRAFQSRAAEEQRRLYQQLSERDQQVSAALNDARTERSRRRRLEADLEAITADRRRLAEQLAQQDLEFAAERGALIEQFTGIVAAASPEKQAALRRFADGDRIGAFDVIADITYAENAARERAAAAVARAAAAESVRNLETLIQLASQMVLYGEKSLQDVLVIEQQRLALDPSRLAYHLDVIDRLVFSDRFDEAIAAGDAARAIVADDWELMAVEEAILPARLVRQPYIEAMTPWFAVHNRLTADREAVDAWRPDEILRYCDAASSVLSDANLVRLNANMRSLAVICADAIVKTQRFDGKLFEFWIALAQSAVDQRDYTQARRIIDLFRRYVAAFPELERFPMLSAGNGYRLGYLEAQMAIGEGHTELAGRLLGEVAVHADTVRSFTSDPAMMDEVDRSIMVLRGMTAFYAGDVALAQRLAVEGLGPPIPFSPDAVRLRPRFWNARMAMLGLVADYSLQLGDVETARDAIRRVTGLVTTVIGRLPPPQEEIRLDSEERLCTFFSVALSLTRLRQIDGDLEAAESLATLQGFETGLERMTLIDPCYPPLRIAAFIELGGIAAQQGRMELARQRLQFAQQLAEQNRAREPHILAWTEFALEARYRLAQLDADVAAIEVLRAETAAAQTDGRRFTPDTWWRDLAEWTPGEPIRWFAPARAPAAAH